jgi:tetratricopeptide (TPR) repeat protein
MSGVKRHIAMLICLCTLYAATIVPFAQYMRIKPFVEKLGTLPTAAILKFMSADQKLLIGSSLVMKVIIYFGGIYEQSKNKINIPPDFPAMSRTIHAAVKLDPYNIDAYYFAQAFLTWDAKQFAIANALLSEGMKYRTWDWYLPFFVGFNYAYFLHDYKNAAEYYKKAGELSGQELHISLAGRYLQEAGQTSHAIAYLTVMAQGARSPLAKKAFLTRLNAFKGVQQIEAARDEFKARHGKNPASLNELVAGGFLPAVPIDPYGGDFFVNPDGTVGSTSKFAYQNQSKVSGGSGADRREGP